jgi:hypothetical protein
MHGTGWDVQEVTRTSLDRLGSAWTEIQPHPSAEDVQGRLVITVVMPARGRTGLGVDGA